MCTPTRLASALLASALLFAVAPPPASATTVLEVGMSELVQTSEWVVRARVHATRDVDLRPEGRGLFTDVELAIGEVYSGQAVPSRYVLRLIGGRGADGMATLVPGMPSFREGEEVILFLERTSMGHIPCGLGQGVWRVAADAAGRAWVQQSRSGAHRVRRAADGTLRPVHGPLMTEVRPLEELVFDVYETLLGAP